MHFKQITMIVASCVALSNAIAIADPAAAEEGISLEIAAPNHLLARSLEQKVKHVRKLKARADQAEALADQLQTREAEEAAIEAREAHVETAKIVARDYLNSGSYDNFDGLELNLLGLADIDLGSRRQGQYFNAGNSGNGDRRFGYRYKKCNYYGCW
ncbi:hypothetical protein DOTSEDRAFT_29671 [Dothistroma septosporum NZE10]|uniref:Uncharacterized protein n=1 Tax=Dothistroma septosporum (strain NZE10 / CBS 128990) TaxID=675120 RepID=M2YHR9_DOTSN|nr:hypothetical protein DOTSEDRAFT_29671 [Dothistroma septosporum NZE10]